MSEMHWIRRVFPHLDPDVGEGLGALIDRWRPVAKVVVDLEQSSVRCTNPGGRKSEVWWFGAGSYSTEYAGVFASQHAKVRDYKLTEKQELLTAMQEAARG